jgi:hypothetical protein
MDIRPAGADVLPVVEGRTEKHYEFRSHFL